MSAGSLFVPAGNPSLLPHFLRCQTSRYWWTGDRTGREGASDMHRLGKPQDALHHHLTSARSTARGGEPSTNTGDLSGRGRRKPNISPAPRGASVPSQPGTTWIFVSSYTLSLPLFHKQACLLISPFLPASWWFYFWCASLSQPWWAYNYNKPSPRKQFSLLKFLGSVG